MYISLQTTKPPQAFNKNAAQLSFAKQPHQQESEQQIANIYYKPLTAISFKAMEDITKIMEQFRDKNLDDDGKIVSESMTSTGSNLKLLTASSNIFNIVDLTESNVFLKPFDEKEFSPYKPHYIIETPSGFKGMFKFCCMDGHIIRETGARYLSKMLSMQDVMPETIFVKVKTPDYGVQTGSIQKIIKDGKQVNSDPSLAEKVKNSDRAMKDLRQVIMFNYIANNIDTGIGNWLIYQDDEDCKVKSIDHALTGAGGAMLKGVSEIFPELQTIEITDIEKNQIANFLKAKDKNKKILEQFYPPESVNRIIQTAQKIIETGRIEI